MRVKTKWVIAGTLFCVLGLGTVALFLRSPKIELPIPRDTWLLVTVETDLLRTEMQKVVKASDKTRDLSVIAWSIKDAHSGGTLDSLQYMSLGRFFAHPQPHGLAAEGKAYFYLTGKAEQLSVDWMVLLLPLADSALLAKKLAAQDTLPHKVVHNKNYHYTAPNHNMFMAWDSRYVACIWQTGRDKISEKTAQDVSQYLFNLPFAQQIGSEADFNDFHEDAKALSMRLSSRMLDSKKMASVADMVSNAMGVDKAELGQNALHYHLYAEDNQLVNASKAYLSSSLEKLLAPLTQGEIDPDAFKLLPQDRLLFTMALSLDIGKIYSQLKDLSEKNKLLAFWLSSIDLDLSKSNFSLEKLTEIFDGSFYAALYSPHKAAAGSLTNYRQVAKTQKNPPIYAMVLGLKDADRMDKLLKNTHKKGHVRMEKRGEMYKLYGSSMLYIWIKGDKLYACNHAGLADKIYHGKLTKEEQIPDHMTENMKGYAAMVFSPFGLKYMVDIGAYHKADVLEAISMECNTTGCYLYARYTKDKPAYTYILTDILDMMEVERAKQLAYEANKDHITLYDADDMEEYDEDDYEEDEDDDEANYPNS